MAVYTVVDREEVEAFIRPFGIGPLISFSGVAEGIENSVYFITTDQSDFASELQTQREQHYVLTIFEHLYANDLEFYIKLTQYLSLKGLPVPSPVHDADGTALHYIQHKPALLIPKINGAPILQPNETHCQQVGRVLAQIHTECLNFGFEHPDPRGFGWLQQHTKDLKPQLEQADLQLLDEIPRFITLTGKHPNLPKAIIHGDLFRENTLFDDDRLLGIIHFSSAGSGYLALDLAITVNDWCSATDGSLDKSKAAALVNAYKQIRALTDDEYQLWNDFLRVAAARLWIARLVSQLQPESGHKLDGLMETKDPLHYRNILLQRIHNSK